MSFLSLHSFKKYLISSVVSILATIVIIAIAGVIFSFCFPPLWLIKGMKNYTFIFTVLLTAFLSARASSESGLLTGIFSSFVCILILCTTGSILYDSSGFFYSFFKILPIAVICGGIGGILGINSK